MVSQPIFPKEIFRIILDYQASTSKEEPDNLRGLISDIKIFNVLFLQTKIFNVLF